MMMTFWSIFSCFEIYERSSCLHVVVRLITQSEVREVFARCVDVDVDVDVVWQERTRWFEKDTNEIDDFQVDEYTRVYGVLRKITSTLNMPLCQFMCVVVPPTSAPPVVGLQFFGHCFAILWTLNLLHIIQGKNTFLIEFSCLKVVLQSTRRSTNRLQ